MGLTHFSLFTGIGGIDLAAEWAGFKTVAQCEFAEYPTKVLEKHWPDVPRWKDVKDVTAESFQGKTGIEKPTIISAGFPCQPHSVVGKRKSSDDERDLWPQVRRTISEIKPRWFLGENVRGLLSSETGRFFGRILNDLASMGYTVGWCCYGANRVGAVHQRERVFIISNANGLRFHSMGKELQVGRSELDIQIDIQKLQAWRNNSLNSLPDLDGFFANPVSGIQRNDNGISEGLDRLKCLGNAVVPHQVFPILKVIAEIEMAYVGRG